MTSTYDFPGNSRFGPLIKKKTGMEGKQADTAVGGGIPRNYSFMNEIITAYIQGMIHGCLVIFTEVIYLILQPFLLNYFQFLVVKSFSLFPHFFQ